MKLRFVEWVVDLCTEPFDRQWLDYQEEIGLRHMPAKKNDTDHANSPVVVPLRYLIAFYHGERDAEDAALYERRAMVTRPAS